MDTWFAINLENVKNDEELHLDIPLQCGVKRFLINYWYAKSCSKSDIREICEKIKKAGGEVFTDSGGLQILLRWKDKKLPKNFDLDKYFEDYLENIIYIQDLIDHVAELDIDAVVGYDKIKEWRKKFEEAGLDNKLVYVWHNTIPNPYEEWEVWCKQRKFLAIGFAEEGRHERATSFNAISKEIELIQKAHDYRVKIHLLGVKSPLVLLRVEPDSADTGGWLYPIQWGKVLIFTEGRLIEKKFNEIIDHQKLAHDYGLDMTMLIENEPNEMLKLTIKSLLRWEEYKNRTVFSKNSDNEKISEKQLNDSSKNQKISESMIENTNAVKYPPLAKGHNEYCNDCQYRDKCNFFHEGGNCVAIEIMKKIYSEVTQITGSPEKVDELMDKILIDQLTYLEFYKKIIADKLRQTGKEEILDELLDKAITHSDKIIMRLERLRKKKKVVEQTENV